MPVVLRFLLMTVSCGKDNKIRCLFDEESSGNCVAFSVYCRQGMFAGSGLQGSFVEILRLCLISVVKMPEDSRIGVAVCQFDREKPFTAVQLFGQLDMGVHRRVDELHGLERIFSTAGFERWQWFVFRMVLLIVPFPYGWQGKP